MLHHLLNNKLVIIFISLIINTVYSNLIIPKLFSIWRNNKLYNPYLDIRKNLFLKNKPIKIINKIQNEYAFYKIIKTNYNKTCQKNDLPILGDIICVECNSFTKEKKKDNKCENNIYLSYTNFYYAINSSCNGKWLKITNNLIGHCVSLPAYIFI